MRGLDSIPASPSPRLGNLVDFSLFRVGQLTHQALDRVDQDAPLRLGAEDAQRIQLRLEHRRDPEADLRIILHSLTRMRTAGRTAGPSVWLLFTTRHQSTVPGQESRDRAIMMFVPPTIHRYNSRRGSEAH